jgi:hypothetical protein
MLLLAAGLLPALQPKLAVSIAEFLQFLVPSSFTSCAPAGVALAASLNLAAWPGP